MERVADRIILGSSSDALHRIPQLTQAGVTAILNVAKDLTNPFVTHHQFRITHIGLGDGSGNPKGLLYGAVISLGGLIEEGHTVLVHCHEGRSRSPSVVATYLVAQGDYPSIEEALAYLHGVRSRVDPEQGIIEDFNSLDLDIIRRAIW